MAIRFECGDCGKTLSVKDELAGKRVKCPCGAVVVARPAAGGSPVVSKMAGPSKPAAARPAIARPVGNAAAPAARRPRPAANPYAPGASDLSSLFDELTESDLQTQASRDQQSAATQAAIKDPLAGYGDVVSGKRGASGPRPVGVLVLAVLQFLFAAITIAVGALFLLGGQVLDDILKDNRLPQDAAMTVAISMLVAGGLQTIAGVGLLSSQAWGWWFVTGFSAYIGIDRVFALIFGLIDGDVPAAAYKGLGALAFGGGVAAYLFSEHIRTFYGVKMKPLIAIAIILGSTATLAFAVHLTLHLQAAK